MSEEKKITIDEFIEIVAPKLKHGVTYVPEEITGKDLLLTGVKDVKGKPIENDKTYTMQVPARVHQEHKRKLTLAWLRSGAVGIRAYLVKWMDPAVLETVMTVCPTPVFLRK